MAAAEGGRPNQQPAAPLVVVGSVNADLVVSVPRLPLPGETLAGSSDLRFVPGGKGANTAAAAARLLAGGAKANAPVFLVAQTGDDAYAAPLREALDDAGVRLDHVSEVRGAASGTALILLQPGGENSIVLSPAANARWPGGDEEGQEGGAKGGGGPLSAEALACIRSAGALLMQREVPERVNLAAAAAAAAAGVPVRLLDAGGADAPLSDALLALLTHFSPNETELARCCNGGGGGAPVETLEQQRAAVTALQARAAAAAAAATQGGTGGSSGGGGLQVLLKLGAGGSRLIFPAPPAGAAAADEPDLVQPAVPPPPPGVVDTTGAGDTFTAGFVVGLLEGLTPAAAMRLGAAAASICVSRAGAQTSLPSRAEVDALLAAT